MEDVKWNNACQVIQSNHVSQVILHITHINIHWSNVGQVISVYIIYIYGKHAVVPLTSLYFPAIHAVQSAPSGPECPGEHLQNVKFVDPAIDSEFVGQFRHAESPVIALYVLATHAATNSRKSAPVSIHIVSFIGSLAFEKCYLCMEYHLVLCTLDCSCTLHFPVFWMLVCVYWLSFRSRYTPPLGLHSKKLRPDTWIHRFSFV